MKSKRIFDVRTGVLALAVCSVITLISVNQSYELEQLEMDQSATLHIHEIQRDVEYAMDSVYAVQTLVVGADGQPVDLEELSPLLQREEVDPFVRCVMLAPEGVVDQVHPLSGNQELLGLQMPPVYQDADAVVQARQEGQVNVARILTLPDGSAVVAGVLPIYLPREEGGYRAWGSVAVCLDFPAMLGRLRADVLAERGYAYRILLEEDGALQEVYNHSFAGFESVFSHPFTVAGPYPACGGRTHDWLGPCGADPQHLCGDLPDRAGRQRFAAALGA